MTATMIGLMHVCGEEETQGRVDVACDQLSVEQAGFILETG